MSFHASVKIDHDAGPVAVPLAGREKQDVVGESDQNPPDHREKVPVPADAQLRVAGQRNKRAVVLLLVEGVVQLVLRHHLAGEARPLAAGSAVVIPVQLGMGGEDLDAAANAST